MKKANDIQVGGNHYKTSQGMQHWDLIDNHRVGYLEGCATKYLSRFRRKNGLQDLQKARHYLVKLIESRSGGFDQLALPNVSGAIVMRYLSDNAISGREAVYISMMLTWETVEFLHFLKTELDKFIVEYSASEDDGDAGAGYVNQDR